MTPRLCLPSASALSRTMICPTSHILPQTNRVSAYATLGTGGHDFIVEARRLGWYEALALIPKDAAHRRICETLDPSDFPSGGFLERAYAWNWRTDKSRVLGDNIQRAYLAHGWKPATEFPGSADYSGVSGEYAIVVDWKTGHQWLGPVEDHWQMRLLALAVARFLGRERVRVAFAYLRDDGEIRWSRGEFGPIDLLRFAGELKAHAQALGRGFRDFESGKIPYVTEGDHCYAYGGCPAIAHCPEKRNLALALQGDPKWPVEIPEGVTALTDAQAGRAWARLDELEAFAKYVRKQLADRARATPFPTPSGGTVMEVPADPRDVIDGGIAHRVLTERYDAKVADAACPRDATKKSVGEAARAFALANGLTIKTETNEALSAIREAGGITEKRGEPKVKEVPTG